MGNLHQRLVLQVEATVVLVQARPPALPGMQDAAGPRMGHSKMEAPLEAAGPAEASGVAAVRAAVRIAWVVLVE